jgi:cellulose synthase/poly-beta-1,6-N-acetylglucosamine synthase-like glycosyltransferase
MATVNSQMAKLIEPERPVQLPAGPGIEDLNSTDQAHPKLVVAIPAYNEEVAIGSVIQRSLKYADEVLVLDDGSADHTVEVARSAGALVGAGPG